MSLQESLAEPNGLYVEGEFDGSGRLLFFADRAFIKGWAFAAGDGAELFVYYKDLQLGILTPTEERADVGKVYPGAPLRCGFTAEVSIGAIPADDRDGATLTVLLKQAGHILRKADLLLALGKPRCELHIDASSRDGAHLIVTTSNSNLVGWCVAQDEIVAIAAEIGGSTVLPVHYGISRPDVFAIRPTNPNGRNTGFSLFIPELPEGDSDLVLRVSTLRNYTITKKFSLRALKLNEAPVMRPRSRSESLFWRLSAQRTSLPEWTIVLMPLEGDGAEDVGAALQRTLDSLAAAGPNVKALLPAGWRGMAETSVNFDVYAGFADLYRKLRDKNSCAFVSFVAPGDLLDPIAADCLATYARGDIDFVYWDENALVGLDRETVRKTPGAPFVTEFHLNTIGRGWATRLTKEIIDSMDDRAASHIRAYPLSRFYASPERCVHIAEVLSTHCYDDAVGNVDAAALAARGTLLRSLQACYARFPELAPSVARSMGEGRPGALISLPESAAPLVSIIIPTCGAGKRVIKCLRDIRERTSYRAVEIIVLDDTPSSEQNVALRKEIRELADITVPVGGQFNWSRFNNMGAALSRGAVLLFLNDDVEVVTPDWIEQLLCFLNFDTIGAVGPRLLLPLDKCVQSAGVSLLTSPGWARNDFAFSEKSRPLAGGANLVPRNCSALLGAAIAVRRDLFMRVGGFDERLALTFNDLDFCLRVRQLGYQIVCTPFAELIHHEKNSRAEIAESEMEDVYWARWADVHAIGDPYWHPALESESGTYRIDPEPIEAVWRASSAGTRDEIHRILVLRLDHVGDFVQTMPAFHQLRRAFPNAVIELVAGKWNVELARRSELFDIVHELDFYKQRSGDGRAASIEEGKRALADLIGNASFDLVIDMRADGDTRPLLQHINAKHKAGFSHGVQYPWLDISIEWEGNLRQWRKNANGSVLLCRLIGAIEAAFPLSDGDAALWPGLERKSAERRGKLGQAPVIAVHPFAGNEIKMWPEPYWAALTRIIVRAGGCVSLIGTARDRASNEDLVNSVLAAGAEDLTGRFSIPDLLEYLSGVDCFVGCDSGPKHLAASARVPTIGIQSGFVDPVVWTPACNQGVSVIKRVACAPCYLDDIEKCTRTHQCMRQITPAAVFRYVSVLTGLPAAASRRSRGDSLANVGALRPTDNGYFSNEAYGKRMDATSTDRAQTSNTVCLI